ncbi:MAG: PaaI family thioesterase [Salinarimonadaceae bacterium]|nr:MAG: PaaI family thioesterase [Salinarimonadaceae bacterium]
MIEDDGFVGLAGPFHFAETPQGPAFRFQTLRKHRNRNDFLQGGALVTFADRALGATARASIEASSTVTVQLNVQFIDAVRIGETVEVRPQVVRATKSLVFMSGTLKVGERTVAAVNGVWKRITDRPRATGKATTEGFGKYT